MRRPSRMELRWALRTRLHQLAEASPDADLEPFRRTAGVFRRHLERLEPAPINAQLHDLLDQLEHGIRDRAGVQDRAARVRGAQ
jgi:hypothetical protein